MHIILLSQQFGSESYPYLSYENQNKMVKIKGQSYKAHYEGYNKKTIIQSTGLCIKYKLTTSIECSMGPTCAISYIKAH
jgi:hypothetical protein